MGRTVDSGELAAPEVDQGLVRAQLERMLASPAFAQAERLRQFLEFVVSSSLNGDLASLKERIIGIEVYGRDPGYSTSDEPIVRTEARRLRNKSSNITRSTGRTTG